MSESTSLLNRQDDLDTQPAFRPVAGGDGAPMRFDGAARDGKAKPETTLPFATLSTEKWFENG